MWSCWIDAKLYPQLIWETPMYRFLFECAPLIAIIAQGKPHCVDGLEIDDLLVLCISSICGCFPCQRDYTLCFLVESICKWLLIVIFLSFRSSKMRWFKKSSSDAPTPRLLSLSPLRHGDQEALFEAETNGDQDAGVASRLGSRALDNSDVKSANTSRKSRKGKRTIHRQFAAFNFRFLRFIQVNSFKKYSYLISCVNWFSTFNKNPNQSEWKSFLFLLMLVCKRLSMNEWKEWMNEMSGRKLYTIERQRLICLLY
jgi:hypothetical protein